ncbi:MAG: NAD-dependent epimerase/dehydratase family protein [Polyangiaceae bacterium]|nr:NAD-dependent epimerase/dehydratase family protein [Polyangiaceae bacterium]
MSSQRFAAGMVGSGNICEFHVAAVRALPDVRLVGVTDLDMKKAEAAAAKWRTQAFPSLEALVAAGANVIHVLTPPSAHARVALEALERSCHVLVEKPVAESVEDALAIDALARKKGLTASVNHSLLYDPQIRRALDLVRSGSLGQVVSVDILRGSEYPPYEGGPLPPHYRDTGYPFRDLGVHCLYLLQALLGPIEDVAGRWSSIGGDPNLAFDEWRALVRCQRGLGQMQLSWNSKPMQSQIIIHGTRGVLRVDLFAMFHSRRSATPLPKAAERLVNAFTDSLQPLVDVPLGVWKFVRKEVQAYQGLRDLVADYYRRLADGGLPPVAIQEAAEVVRWVETVARAAEADHAAKLAQFPLSPRVEVLVTGASGSLGSAVVRRLVAEGKPVRAFVRRIPSSPLPGVEYCFGNLGDPFAVDRAVLGATTVIHVGAAMKGGWPEHLGGTVVGTQNVIDACRKHGVSQLVHISSMSVIDWAGSSGRGSVTEDAPLEPRAEERGAYTRAKLEAEKRVRQAAQEGLRCVILRPGQIFGGGIALVNGAVARKVGGRWLMLGDGGLELPLVYIDDVVDATLAAMNKRLHSGEVIQIVDNEHLTQEDVLVAVGAREGIVKVPRAVVFGLGKLSELPFGALGRPSPLALYRLQSALAKLHYESGRAEQLLGWKPRVGVREGIRRVCSST